MPTELNPRALSWDEADPARHPFGSGSAARPRADAMSHALAEHYGGWAVGRRWAHDEGEFDGGPVGSWCCPSHSVDTPEATLDRVVAGLCEWRNRLEQLAGRFETYPLDLSALTDRPRGRCPTFDSPVDTAPPSFRTLPAVAKSGRERYGIGPDTRQPLDACLAETRRRAREQSVHACPPLNAVPMSWEDWRRRFGLRWHDFGRAKHRFDPREILPMQGATQSRAPPRTSTGKENHAGCHCVSRPATTTGRPGRRLPFRHRPAPVAAPRHKESFAP